MSAPIWHDYMEAASDGFCGDFPAPAVPWTGTAYFGAHSTAPTQHDHDDDHHPDDDHDDPDDDPPRPRRRERLRARRTR